LGGGKIIKPSADGLKGNVWVLVGSHDSEKWMRWVRKISSHSTLAYKGEEEVKGVIGRKKESPLKKTVSKGETGGSISTKIS